MDSGEKALAGSHLVCRWEGLEVGRWKVEGGRLKVGRWKVEGGRWKVEGGKVGRWKVEGLKVE